jgi:hypothetical protein
MLGVVVHQEVSNFLRLSHHSLRAHTLGRTFHLGDVFHFLTHRVLGVSALGLTLGMFFLEGPHLPSGKTHHGGMFGPGTSHSPGSDTILGGTHSSRDPQPSNNTNIG